MICSVSKKGTGKFTWEARVKKKKKKELLRSPAQVGCMRQVLGAGALVIPRGMGWGGRWEG